MATRTQTLRASRWRTGVLQIPAYRRLLGSFAVSRAGDFVYNTALVVVVLQRTGSAGWVAAALVSRLLPYALLTPFAGVLADRVDRRRLMVLADVTRAVLMVAAAVVVATDAPVPVLLLVATLATSAGTPFLAALSASIAEVVPEDRLASANALVSGVDYAATIVGPLLSAFVLWAGLDSLPFALNAASFVASAVLLAGIRIPRHGTTTDEDDETFWRATARGVRVLHEERMVRVTTLVTVAIAFTYGTELVLMPLVSRDRLGTGESGLGVLEACVGVGGVLGVALAARLARGQRLPAVLGVTAVGNGIPMALLSIVHVPAVAYALLLVEGLAAVTLDVVAITALQRTVPIDKLARTDGLMLSMTVSATVLGNLCGPALVATLHLERALVSAAAVCVLAGLAVLLGESRRRVPSPEPGLTSILSGIGALQGLGLPALEALSRAATPAEEVRAGDRLLEQGEPADEVLLLVSGDCEVLATADGREDVVNRVTGPDLLGEIGVLHALPRTASVRSVSACVVRRLPASAFLAAVLPSGSLVDAPAALTSSVERRLLQWPGGVRRAAGTTARAR